MEGIEDTATVGMFDFETMMGISEEVKEDEIENTAEMEDDIVDTQKDEEVESIEVEEEDLESRDTKEDEDGISENDNKEEGTQKNVYSNLVKKYIDLGIWQDAKVEIDGEEVVLSEIGDLDEETFLNIQKSQHAAFKEDISEKYINKEELDEISLAIIDISKNKGDISRALDIKKRFIDPLEHFDLDNELHQEDLVRQKYMIQSNGALSESDIDAIIEARKKDLTLDKEAYEYAEQLKKGYKAYLANESKKLEEERLQEEQSIKNLKKQVRDSLEKYGLNDASRRSLSNFIGTKDNDPLMEMIQEIKSDPDKLAELIFFLNKKDDYIKAISNKATKDTGTKVLRTLKFIQDSKKETKSGKQQIKNEDEEEFELIFK